ncbi:MAG: hypothetical protein A2X56_10235 [Nitrospirae bacterium GWC2_57_13]|jgi:AcrR family transcriptional regulator|nr:MAG: hypothetical protein A2072_01995 [Nitrospirae bacterium GWC1_57_7]OGW26750.1 MAG: hypothetical protein A2X56_10235 [Nitrospirae bacterium GWC2_57_13]HAR45381.1 TetR/AcrR family transcriptional regulator [Nitrospiraceae bacterium]
MGRNGGAKIRGEVRREQVVTATLRIIGKKGVSGLTTAAIAREVGMSEANIYRHFKNKEEILYETGKSIGRSLSSNLDAVWKMEIQPIAKLKKIFQLHLEFLKANDGIPRLAFSEEMHVNNARLRKLFLQNIQAYSTGLEEIIGHGVRSGIIRKNVDPQGAALMMIGMIQVTLMRWSLSGRAFDLVTEGMKLWTNCERYLSEG